MLLLDYPTVLHYSTLLFSVHYSTILYYIIPYWIVARLYEMPFYSGCTSVVKFSLLHHRNYTYPRHPSTARAPPPAVVMIGSECHPLPPAHWIPPCVQLNGVIVSEVSSPHWSTSANGSVLDSHSTLRVTLLFWVHLSDCTLLHYTETTSIAGHPSASRAPPPVIFDPTALLRFFTVAHQ